MDKGWICLHRRFLDWEWYGDLHVRIFFIHCLLRANHTTNKWRGYTIKAGQFISSLNHLAKETGLTERQIRTCIKKLKSTNDIDTQTTSRNTMIIIKNWNKWQTERHTKRQASDKQVTTNNNDNNEYIDTNSYINISSSSSIELTKEEEELLKSHSKRNKIKYFKPWLRKILGNGDYKELLEKEKRLQAKELKNKKEVEAEEVIETPEDLEKIKEIQKRIKERSKRR